MAKLYCYLVTYDISDQKRWRKVFRVMNGYGNHVQLSVFRCDLSQKQMVEMKSELTEVIHHREDQVLVVKLGPSNEKVLDEIDVIGRPREFNLPGANIF